MGGADGKEPPPKRLKSSFEDMKGLSNGLPIIESISTSSRNSMDRTEQNQVHTELVGLKGLIKRDEFVHIIAESLYSLGFKKSGALLEEESGVSVHVSLAKLFMQQIRDGDWDGSIVTLHKIGVSDETVVMLASFLIFEQKFFELLDGKNVIMALNTLRTELTPLCIDHARVRELSSCILTFSLGTVDVSPIQSDKMFKSRSILLEKLQNLLPPTVMIPERRLEHLVEQALSLQHDACRFHNSLDREMSLYTDHQCGRNHIPSQILQVLDAHDDEVWFLKFSHNGKYLASSSKDCSAIIWEVHIEGVFLKHRLIGHQKSVSSISWSPDDHRLLTCGVEEVVRLWNVSSGQCLHIYKINGLGLVSCGWFPHGKCILSGVNDKSIRMWDLNGNELECWKGNRTRCVSDIGITKDGKHVISICRDTAILVFDRESKVERFIEEDQKITSFSLSRDTKFLLVCVLNQEIHLWNIEGNVNLIARYNGHKRERFVINSCFGGSEQTFIASGSEDSQVYIWLRDSGELIAKLSGHSGVVNCVSWNPVNPHMFASASDDRTIRIWGLDKVNLSVDRSGCNGGFGYCNGATQI